MALRFEWDEAKARSNSSKHGVAFPEAATVFADPLSLLLPDVQHSQYEERFALLGHSERQRLLVVAHTRRNDSIRIISARTATPKERRNYEEA